jgi:hypothetical protein
MATYLIQDNVAHFYSNENVDVEFQNSKTIHADGHPINIIKSHNVKKVINVPFKLNKVFIRL